MQTIKGEEKQKFDNVGPVNWSTNKNKQMRTNIEVD